MARPYLDLLLLSNDHFYSETDFRILLNQIPNVRLRAVERYIHSAWSYLRDGRVNTIMLDPGSANSFDDTRKFIEDVRSKYPLVVFVLCARQSDIDAFIRWASGRFDQYFKLDYSQVRSTSDEQLQRILGVCEAEYLNNFRRNYAYEVALSFAGEQRKDAEELAACLTSRGIKVGSVTNFDFRGKIRKSALVNSMTYRRQNSRKSNFATEPKIACMSSLTGPIAHRGTRAQS